MANAMDELIGTDNLYRIIPCLHGVCASPTEEATMKLRNAQSTKSANEAVLLPGGIDDDIYLPNESIAFPKTICLRQDDLRSLDCSNPDNFSFTHYGPPPPKQDKPTNQDFALSGHFENDAIQPSRFTILADGISNGYGFSQRGAQLSCFAAYECLKELHARFNGSQGKLDDRDIKQFRNDLASKIGDFFRWDIDHLRAFFDAGHSEPANISSKVWRKYFKDDEAKWYGNTLIVSFLSPFGGFVVFAGDGGIVLLKGDSAITEVMRSPETSTLDRFVSVGVSAATFQGAHIEYDEADDFVEIISLTDGLDRTYQINDLDIPSAFSKDAKLSDLIDQIGNLDDRVKGEVDFDNYSIARIFLPLSSKPHARMTRNGDNFVQEVQKQPNDVPKHETKAHLEPSETSFEKKKDRSMKLPLTPVLLGVAIGLGLSNALVLGLASMSGSGTASEETNRPEMAAAEAAARMAASSAGEILDLQNSVFRFSAAVSTAQQQVEAAQTELASAEANATSTSEQITELTTAVSTAQQQVEAAQTELESAEQELLTAKDEAERAAKIAAQTAATAINQMESPRQ